MRDIDRRERPCLADLFAQAPDDEPRAHARPEIADDGGEIPACCLVATGASLREIAGEIDALGGRRRRVRDPDLLQGALPVARIAAKLFPQEKGEDERKLCGILCEVAPTAPLVVVGIGLNVDQDRAELPVATATSLRLCGVPGTAGAVCREALLAALGDALAEVVSAWSSAGDAGLAVQQRYRSLCATLGRSVRVVLPGAADLVGTAETVDEHGRVVVRGLDGQAHPVAAGDVVHLRHTGSASPADATLT